MDGIHKVFAKLLEKLCMRRLDQRSILVTHLLNLRVRKEDAHQYKMTIIKKHVQQSANLRYGKRKSNKTLPEDGEEGAHRIGEIVDPMWRHWLAESDTKTEVMDDERFSRRKDGTDQVLDNAVEVQMRSRWAGFGQVFYIRFNGLPQRVPKAHAYLIRP